jgi:serine/threonine-protein kinase
MRIISSIVLSCVACGTSGPGSTVEDRRHHVHDAAVDTATTRDAPRADAPRADASPPADAAPADAPPADASLAGVGPYFATSMFFNADVSSVSKSTKSDTIIAALRTEGGWGNSDVMQIDFALDVLAADGTTPMMSFMPTGDFYTPDCDLQQVPVPAGGNLEGETGYACTTNGDCHLIVYRRDTKQLYEMWRANIKNGTFYGGCLAVWNGMKTYTDVLRGDQCTSADAAGYPIAPLLFTADEVAAGHVDHAIRFILPNDRVQRGYTRPATHGTSTTGIAGAPYYGVHLRLRADYPIASLPSAGARVVARAMQKYGMYHADGGNIALTAQSDRHTTAKWAGLLGARDLAALRVEDFEVIDHGAPIALTGDCVRAP